MSNRLVIDPIAFEKAVFNHLFASLVVGIVQRYPTIFRKFPDPFDVWYRFRSVSGFLEIYKTFVESGLSHPEAYVITERLVDD